MMNHLDWIREILLLEPRGYPCQNVNFIFDAIENGTGVEPSFLRYVIGEQGRIYPAMSGHNTICVATALLECGIVEMVEPTTQFKLEAPAGLIHITASCHDGKAESITFRNEPAFVEKLNVKVNVPGGIGQVIVDIAYGGMWYAVVDAASIGLELDPRLAKKICKIGQMIKVATREQHPVQHPTLDYPGVDILVFRGKASPRSGADSRNAVVMTNQELDWDKPETWRGMLDRSPCGTGTCAIMAVMHARGELQIGQPFVHESIIGSLFTGVLIEETNSIPGRRAVIPQVTGSAYITQFSKVVIDPTDPFPCGFRVDDIW
jgi:proline racemase